MLLQYHMTSPFGILFNILCHMGEGFAFVQFVYSGFLRIFVCEPWHQFISTFTIAVVPQEVEAEEEGDGDLLPPLDVVVGETEIDAFN